MYTQRIDEGFGRGVVSREEVPPPQKQKPVSNKFEPYKGKKRKSGTGCVSQIIENLWEGRYSPKWIDGKRISRNIYAHSHDECEEKLSVLIAKTKAELAEIRSKSAPL